MSSSHSVLIVTLVAVVALGGMYVMSGAVTNFPFNSPLSFSTKDTITGAEVVDFQYSSQEEDVDSELSSETNLASALSSTDEADQRKRKCVKGEVELDTLKATSIFSPICYFSIETMLEGVELKKIATEHPQQCVYLSVELGGESKQWLGASGARDQSFPSDKDCVFFLDYYENMFFGAGGAGAKLIGYAGFQPSMEVNEEDSDGQVIYPPEMQEYQGHVFCKHTFLDGTPVNQGIGAGAAVCCRPCGREEPSCATPEQMKDLANENGDVTDEALAAAGFDKECSCTDQNLEVANS